MRRCDGEAQLISSQRNNTPIFKRLMDVLLLSMRIDVGGLYPSATPLKSCMSGFGGRGCRSCCAWMEEEKRPLQRVGVLNSTAPNGNAPEPLHAAWPRDGRWADLGRETHLTARPRVPKTDLVCGRLAREIEGY